MNRTNKIAALAFLASFLFGLVAFAAPPAKAPPKSETTGLVHVATCNDGKEYYATENRHGGACRGHGGVAKWADGTPVKSKGKKGEYR